ncbi:uncharacterized protein isoform X2 [Leptinotarsa decemlineata]|uniref:uncharacterized protein isoform X2 n=1 Tax=Leptinotarsa decemlineata TaxID=7539 RepID=UPI003D305543
MATMGIQLEFNPEINEWSIHYKRLNQFFIANAITSDSVKRAILLNSLHQNAYTLLQTLCVPDNPENTDLKNLVKKLDEYYTKKSVVFVERFNFYTAAKLKSESAQKWSSRLNKLAMNCEFDTSFDTKLCDKFITGYNPGKVRNKLFSEKKDVTYAEALNIAIIEESALTGIIECESEMKQEPREADINWMSKRRAPAQIKHCRGSHSSQSQASASPGCFRGRKEGGGSANERNVKCFRCGKGHYANKCPFQ